MGTNTGQSALSRLRMACSVVIAAAVLLFAPAADALEVRRAEGESKTITVAVDEIIDDTLIVTADAVTIDGVVTGNLIALGRRIEVNGSVRGDLICGGQRVFLNGEVNGNVLCLGRGIDVTGAVGQSIHAFAGDIRFTDSARAGGDLFAFASELAVDGIVGRDALLFAGSSEVGGTVGRNLTARTGVLTLTDSAHVGGDLTAHTDSEDNIRIASGATIEGARETKLSNKGEDDGDDDEATSEAGAFLGSVIWKLFGIGAAFITGLVLFLLCPNLFAARIDEPATVARTMGIGFLCLVAGPIAALILMATLIGIPVGVLAFVAWLVALYVAGILVAAILGARMLRKPTLQLSTFALGLLFGLIVLTLAMSVPFLGLFVRLAVTTLGLGLLCTWTYARWKPT